MSGPTPRWLSRSHKLSLRGRNWTLTAKSLCPPPDKHREITDPVTRFASAISTDDEPGHAPAADRPLGGHPGGSRPCRDAGFLERLIPCLLGLCVWRVVLVAACEHRRVRRLTTPASRAHGCRPTWQARAAAGCDQNDEGESCQLETPLPLVPESFAIWAKPTALARRAPARPGGLRARSSAQRSPTRMVVPPIPA
jgi:hypothetical protein